MLMLSVTPATSSTMTDLPSGGWQKALAVLEVPALRHCGAAHHATASQGLSAGGSQKSLEWAGPDVTAHLPSLCD